MNSGLYRGTLTHVRRTPVRNAFRYPVCFYALDLDELPALDRRLRLFGRNRPAVLGFRDADHLGDVGRPVGENVRAHLAAHGVELEGGRIVLVTNLRVLGYVFNPISLFYCYGPDEALRCVLAEVGNTFGERHAYVLGPERRVADDRRLVYEHPKRMHVSPFNDTGGVYRFVLSEPGTSLRATVSLLRDGHAPFHATLRGRREPLTDPALARALLRYPLMAQAVTGLIHWQAVVLYLKGMRVQPKPTFIPGEGSEGPAEAEAAEPGGRRLRPVPAARRTPLAPVARRATRWALGRPARGEVTLRLPDGTHQRAGDPATGPRVTVTVRAKDAWRRLGGRGRLGIGEGYVAGDWDADDLVGLLEILAWSAEAARERPLGRLLDDVGRRRPRLPPRATMAGARRDIEYHYDLGNDFYRLFLDPSLAYSCALFDRPGASLEEAQEAKHRRIGAKLRLTPQDHVLEIGCGWGGFALHAAGEWGARVTGVTLSVEQHALARERVREAGLADRVEILLQDYRTVPGRFSRIASIEMLEAIGDGQLGVFFATCDRLLEPDGLACIQTIAVPDQRYERYRRNDDFIRRYIFPGALIPSLAAILRATSRDSRLGVESVEEIGPHYAETLRRWRERFLINREEIVRMGYDERFVRAWEYYLAFCEAAFRTRALHDYQLLLTRPMNARLPVVPVAQSAS